MTRTVNIRGCVNTTEVVAGCKDLDSADSDFVEQWSGITGDKGFIGTICYCSEDKCDPRPCPGLIVLDKW